MDVLYRLFLWLFRERYSDAIGDMAKAISSTALQSRESEKALDERRIAHSYILKPVISCSNEYDDPMVGIVVDIGGSDKPLYIIKDYVKHRTYVTLEVPYKYDRGLLKDLVNLGHEGRRRVLFRETNLVSKTDGKIPHKLLSYEELDELLTLNGFEKIANAVKHKEHHNASQ